VVDSWGSSCSRAIDGIVMEHCMGAEIAEARGTLTCVKEHQSVDIRNALGHQLMYRAITHTRRVFTTYGEP